MIGVLGLLKVEIVSDIVLDDGEHFVPAHPFGDGEDARSQEVLDPVLLVDIDPPVEQVDLVPPLLLSLLFEIIHLLLLYLTLALEVLNHNLLFVEVHYPPDMPFGVHVEVHNVIDVQFQEFIVEDLGSLVYFLVEFVVSELEHVDAICGVEV